MKDKKTILIIGLSILVMILIVFLAYFAGAYAGMRSVTNGAGESPSVKQESDISEDKEKHPDETFSEEMPSEERESLSEKDSSIEDETSEEEVIQDGGLVVKINTANTWGENPVNSQLDIILENTTDKDIAGWEVHIKVGNGADVQSGWRCKYAVQDGELILNSEEYNYTIPAGGSCDMGVIMYDITGDLSYTTKILGTQEASGGNAGQNNNQNSQQNNNQNSNQNTQANAGALEVPAPTTDDWLHVEGNKIVDSKGKQVWLTGVNWFGYNTGSNIFDGLWNSDLNESIQSIANHGFNLIRVPMSAELILQWKSGQYPTANFNQATNHYLVNMNSLEIFDYVVGQCRANGIKIMIDIHSAKTDSMGHMSNMWYNGDITTEKYQEALVWMAQRYAKDDTIIAYDLKNEPHGKPYESDKAIWNDSKAKNNWKYVAEQTALMVLEKNPNVLIMVEGTEIYPVNIRKNGDYSSTNDADYYFNWWGGNLRGVADYPIDLGKYQDQLVYSPHDYGPAVYQQPWFANGYDYESLYRDCWRDNWLYIHEESIAPLLIGEWGGFMTEPNLTWMTHMRTLISNYNLHHTFWCFNANSGDTGGLVKDDFKTWDEEKYAFVKEVLWQQNGKFVGLDHEIPLGTAGNGITLNQAKGLNR